MAMRVYTGHIVVSSYMVVARANGNFSLLASHEKKVYQTEMDFFIYSCLIVLWCCDVGAREIELTAHSI